MNTDRRAAAQAVRQQAAQLAANRTHPPHRANSDELKFRSADGTPNHLANFTKGLPHDETTGLVKNPADFQQFILGIDSGDPRDFVDTPLGPMGISFDTDDELIKVWKSPKTQHAVKALISRGQRSRVLRAWESQAAGLTFDLQGPDAQAVTIPPAPELGSPELTAEMGEVYVMALLRDIPFWVWENGIKHDYPSGRGAFGEYILPLTPLLSGLEKLPWFSANDGNRVKLNDGTFYYLNQEEKQRLRVGLNNYELFRGITPGDRVGPYISQFLLSGTRSQGTESGADQNGKGRIAYGSITIDQRVSTARAFQDHMTTWEEWLDVQHGANLAGFEEYEGSTRFIWTPRDLATYVHYDALYQAYLNACLILLAEGYPLDPGLPFTAPDFQDHQQGFAQFGGPHILSLVTEVATRALKAVRYQKFNIHRRLRPEALAARIYKQAENKKYFRADELETMLNDLLKSEILTNVGDRNERIDPKTGNLASVNYRDPKTQKPIPLKDGGNYLLPMPFREGSPMHPAYGAGHATVAGACVTILKAFFDHGQPLTLAGSDTKAFVPKENGKELGIVAVANGERLTVEGELNKLASNISIGRNWAGVHYFTDYIESVRLGEQIAIGMLEEQKLTYGENFSMTVPLFDGSTVRI